MSPRAIARFVHTTIGHFVAVMMLLTLVNAGVLLLIHREYASRMPDISTEIGTVLWGVFLAFSLLAVIVAWVFVLAQDSRRAARAETDHRLDTLIEEIAAHETMASELHKAKEVAEAASAAKTRYMVSVSHEIRSPLNSIYGYAQLLESGSGVGAEEAGRVIRRSSEHLSNLVEGLLDISQVESGVLRLSRDTIRLPAFLDQIVNMFQPQAKAKGISFVHERPKKLPDFVRTDQKRLRQILINLLSNAIKFTERGQVRFRVSYRSELAVFEIIDTGIGIEPEDVKRIFAPFERGSGDTVRRQQGIGLGLSITNALVQIMGGEISVQSTPRKGTSFTVRVMLSRTMDGPADTRPVRAVTGYEGETRAILAIDDDQTQLNMLRNLLESLGFAVFTALDGDSGIALAARVVPHLVLLDITMPGRSGWDVARTLREQHGKDIRIVMVSADAHEFKRGDDGREAHDMFLMKPVEFGLLLDTITEQLGLIWIASEPDSAEPAAANDLAPIAEAEPFLAEIERLVRIGHVRGIEAEIARMETAVPAAASLARRLNACLDNYDFKTLNTTLQASRAPCSLN